MFINQRLTDHESDREADVILAWPGVGIAVIEVKGGSVSAHPRWTRGRPRLAHLIALTATELDDTFTTPTDAPRWMIIDRSEIQHAPHGSAPRSGRPRTNHPRPARTTSISSWTASLA